MRRPPSISRALVVAVLTMMYLVTSSTALAHAMSHMGPCRAERQLAVDVAHDADGADPSAAGCFFCHHGPAVAAVALPGALPSPLVRPVAIVADREVETVAAQRASLPGLRAPPSRS